MKATCARIIAEMLSALGTERIYGIIGTSNVAFVDTLFDLREKIRFISCRHEQVAASMADAEGRLTGKPGVALVHSGPGACNALISLANAYKDCSPMILLTGAVKKKLRGCDGMLELDHCALFSGLCKGTFRIESAEMAADILREAWKRSLSGAKGPVLIEVPEDIWGEETEFKLNLSNVEPEKPDAPSAETVKAVIDRLKNAKFPLILSGGGVAYSKSETMLIELVHKLQIPVITTGNGRGTIREDDALCFGRVGFGGGNNIADSAFENCDVLLCLGAGLSDMTTYEFTLIPQKANITVVNISRESISPLSPECSLIQCDVRDFLRIALEFANSPVPGALSRWNDVLSQARSEWNMLLEAGKRPGQNGVSPGLLAEKISETYPENIILSVGAGMHLLYPMAYIKCVKPLTFISAVNFGSMGFGFAASMTASLIHPDTISIAILGDGDFMMTMQDLETAVREKIPIKTFIFNDGMYRVLNFRQRIQFGGRIYGTEHGNPDFAEIATAFGATGFRIARDSEIEEVLIESLKTEGPVVVDALIDRDNVPPFNIQASLKMSLQ